MHQSNKQTKHESIEKCMLCHGGRMDRTDASVNFNGKRPKKIQYIYSHQFSIIFMLNDCLNKTEEEKKQHSHNGKKSAFLPMFFNQCHMKLIIYSYDLRANIKFMFFTDIPGIKWDIV